MYSVIRFKVKQITVVEVALITVGPSNLSMAEEDSPTRTSKSTAVVGSFSLYGSFGYFTCTSAPSLELTSRKLRSLAVG